MGAASILGPCITWDLIHWHKSVLLSLLRYFYSVTILSGAFCYCYPPTLVSRVNQTDLTWTLQPQIAHGCNTEKREKFVPYSSSHFLFSAVPDMNESIRTAKLILFRLGRWVAHCAPLYVFAFLCQNGL